MLADTYAKIAKAYPKAKYYLNYETPAQLVVAAILSAQCRDEIVNASTKPLFEECKEAKDFTTLSADELLIYIKDITYARAKAPRVLASMQLLVDKHNGHVPKTIEELVELPGVGKKTANTILTNAFGIVKGIVVDTHVIKVGNRLGWYDTKNADKIERLLMEQLPKSRWKKVQWVLKTHGRAACKKPIPKCSICPVQEECPKIGVKKFT